MKLAVIDANIFIDLIKLQMLALLFRMEIEIHTTQEIVDQLRDEQQEQLKEFIEATHLKIYLLSEEELEEVINLEAPRSLELADKSVTWLSLQLKAIVLSGDGPLRRFCESKKLEVRGIIWLFDSFIEKKLILHALAIDKMNQLLGFNGRLPKEECMKRIREWKKVY
jgi:hypothetical protein